MLQLRENRYAEYAELDGGERRELRNLGDSADEYREGGLHTSAPHSSHRNQHPNFALH